MSEVRVRENESLESALKRFKRSCAKSGVLAEVRKREYYDSPSVKRRKKSEAARKNKKECSIDLSQSPVPFGTGFFASEERCAQDLAAPANEFFVKLRCPIRSKCISM